MLQEWQAKLPALLLYDLPVIEYTELRVRCLADNNDDEMRKTLRTADCAHGGMEVEIDDNDGAHVDEMSESDHEPETFEDLGVERGDRYGYDGLDQDYASDFDHGFGSEGEA